MEKPAQLLARWVSRKHEGQTKKYNGEPYFIHVSTVAEMAAPATLMGYEIGLCHDLLEDTGTTENELFETLLSFGYNDVDANYITVRVVELTDVFTSAAYPDLSRAERKEKEALRLASVSPGAQTVKYCDLIYNMNLVLRYDKENAPEYLRKKKLLLLGMADGDKGMRQKAFDVIDKGLTAITRW